MTDLIIAGGLIALLLLAMLVFGVLHVGVKAMSVIDLANAFVARIESVVQKLESLDPAGFVSKVQSDAAAVASAAETELQPVLAALEAPVASLEALAAKIEALVNPPTPAAAEPAAEPAPAA